LLRLTISHFHRSRRLVAPIISSCLYTISSRMHMWIPRKQTLSIWSLLFRHRVSLGVATLANSSRLTRTSTGVRSYPFCVQGAGGRYPSILFAFGFDLDRGRFRRISTTFRISLWVVYTIIPLCYALTLPAFSFSIAKRTHIWAFGKVRHH
jgi:hypothetical protein